MSVAQWTVVIVLFPTAILLTTIFYIGVKRCAASRVDSFLAAFSASTLLSTGIALTAGAIVNALFS